MFSKTITGRPLILAACLLVVGVSCFAVESEVAVAQGAANSVTVTQNAATVGRYDIYELTMENATHYENPWEDPAITAVFTSPTGSTYTVGGFLYDQKDKTNIWKVRFAPPEVGAWSWTLSFANTMDKNPPFVTSGKFTCVASANSGFLRIHPCNNYRFMTEGEGKAFYPHGATFPTGNNPPLTDIHSDWFCTDDSWQPTNIDDFFLMAKDGGQNMVRERSGLDIMFKTMFNIKGTGKNNYQLSGGQYWDGYMRAVHQVDWKLMMSPWGGTGTTIGDCNNLEKVPGDPAVTRACLNYYQYIINRYGAYVDIWELFTNQRNVPTAYLDTVLSYVRDHDPYHHLITGNYYPADRADFDVVSDLPFGSTDDLTFGTGSARKAVEGLSLAAAKASNRNSPPLLMVGWTDMPYATAYSLIKQRLSEWALFFNRGACIRNEVARGNGWEKRATEKIFTDAIADFDPTAKPAALTLTPAKELAGYALSSQQDLGMYFLHTTTQHAFLSGATVEVNVPADNMKGQWLDPATGVSLEQPLTLKAGLQKLTIPPFKNDIALRLRAGVAAQTIQFDNYTYHVNSDQSGATLTVTRQGDPSGAVTVNYATRDGLAKAGKDYTATAGTLSWAAGEAKSKTITVPLIPTGLLRPDIDFLVDLSSPSDGAGLGLSHSALVAIVNTVVNTVAQLEPTYYVKNGAGKIDFTLKRLGKGVGPLTIPYSTGGASPGKDYVNIPPDDQHFLRWEDGDLSPKTFSVMVLSNSEATGDREFEVNLGDYYYCGDLPFCFHGCCHRVPLVAGSAPPAFPHSMVVIQQDPKLSPGVVQFKGGNGYATNVQFAFFPKYTVSATNSSAVIPVSRTHGSHGEVTAKYITIGCGTAEPNLNYLPVKGTLTWADGDSADKYITLPLINTPTETGEVTVWLQMDPPSGGAHLGLVTGKGRGYGISARAEVTIVYPPSR